MLPDLRLALRTLARSRGFAAVALLTLALGISINATMFSLVDAVLLTPPPFAATDRVVAVYGENPGHPRSAVAYPDIVDFRERARSIAAIAVHRWANYSLATSGDAERLAGTVVSSDFFRVFGVRPALGRTFLAGEDRAGAGRVVVLADGFWRRRFGADPAVVGRALTLNGEPYTIVGVMPPAFEFPAHTELWAPYVPDPWATDRGTRYLQAVARLAPDASLDRARGELSRLAAAIAADHPESSRGWGASMVPLHEALTVRVRQSLVVLEGAVGFVLLIACANVANLLLGRISRRTREVAVRVALGATRGRLVRQLLTESLVLALLASALGALLALWQVRLLAALVSQWIPPWAHPTLDARALAFTIVVAAITGLLFGLAPALRGAAAGVRNSLAASSRTHAGGGGRLQRALVVAEVSLSLVLLASAALLIGAFVRLQRAPTGFDPSGVLVARVTLTDPVVTGDPARVRAFSDALLARLRAIPGVDVAGAISELPLGGSWTGGDFTIEGRPAPEPGSEPVALHQIVTPGYFRAMRVAIRRGRDFADRDDERAPRVAIINETFARRHFAGENPLGRRLRPGGSDSALTIVGVAADVLHQAVTDPPQPTWFVPARQAPSPGMVLVLRTAAAPEGLTAALRAALREVDPRVPLYGVATLRSTVDRTLTTPRLSGMLLGTFAALSVVLATIGLYGVIALGVTQRRRELAVRAALGAQRRDLLRLVVGQGATLTVWGLALGGAAAFALARVLASRLPGVEPDVGLIAAATVVLGLVALLASYVPALAAARMAPGEAMRGD